MNCCIIDDEFTAVALLTDFTERTPGLVVTCTETNPLIALSKINNNEVEVDILLLDLDMPELHGTSMPLLLNRPIPTIFTSAHQEYALDAFNLNVLDFLHKPFSYERFLKAIGKASAHFLITNTNKAAEPEKPKYLESVYIKPGGKGKYAQIEMKDIFHMESRDNVLLVRVENEEEEFKTRYVLEEIIKELDPEQFMRVHRSFIVNLSKIKAIAGGVITLKNGFKIPIGDNYKEEVKKMISRSSFSGSNNNSPEDSDS